MGHHCLSLETLQYLQGNNSLQVLASDRVKGSHSLSSFNWVPLREWVWHCSFYFMKTESDWNYCSVASESTSLPGTKNSHGKIRYRRGNILLILLPFRFLQVQFWCLAWHGICVFAFKTLVHDSFSKICPFLIRKSDSMNLFVNQLFIDNGSDVLNSTLENN